MPTKEEIPTSLRIPTADLDRASRLAKVMEATTGVSVSRSSVILAAIRAGLETLESKNATEPSKRRR